MLRACCRISTRSTRGVPSASDEPAVFIVVVLESLELGCFTAGKAGFGLGVVASAGIGLFLAVLHERPRTELEPAFRAVRRNADLDLEKSSQIFQDGKILEIFQDLVFQDLTKIIKNAYVY